jgi:dihydroxyacetone kinase-like predicted kinase
MAFSETMATGPWDGWLTAQALRSGFQHLARHVDHLNRLNVFPIPDADTGTNLSRTVERASDALATVEPGSRVGPVLAGLARTLMMDARGNSGVIFAEAFRAWAETAADHAVLRPADLATGWQVAAESARRAVADPAEGTILTALRAAADAMRAVVRGGDAEPMHKVFTAAAQASRIATESGPELLPVLRRHGVVDAGALGLTLFLDGIAAVLEGGAEAAPSAEALDAPQPNAGQGRYGFEVQCLVETEARRDSILGALEPLGESLVVIGQDGLYRVHIHTFDPDAVVAACRRMGAVDRLTVDSLDEQIGHGAS